MYTFPVFTRSPKPDRGIDMFTVFVTMASILIIYIYSAHTWFQHTIVPESVKQSTSAELIPYTLMAGIIIVSMVVVYSSK